MHKMMHKKLSLILIELCFFLKACSPYASQLSALTSIEDKEIEMQPPEKVNPSSLTDEQMEDPPTFTLPTSLERIRPENAGEIKLLGSFLPQPPPFFAISPDGKYSAIGRFGKIEIIETASGDLISTFEVQLPDCPYGFGQYLVFNHDGSFLAASGIHSLYVWQTGGGLIFESQYAHDEYKEGIACGLNIPQLSLSPNGRLLAVSGIEKSAGKMRAYFRVIDTQKNEALYSWDGEANTLHGNLVGFDGLGFSADGKFIQTFDASRFILKDGNLQTAFRFWSAETWSEVTNEESVRLSFNTGELLFPLSDSNQIKILDKLNGKQVAVISVDRCLWDSPCQMRFSADGSKAFVLAGEGELVQYRHTILYPSIQVWDLNKGAKVTVLEGLFRNMDGIMVNHEGKLIGVQGIDEDFHPSWWTFKDLFQGLISYHNDSAFFVPTWTSVNADRQCRYCSTCRLDAESLEISCLPGVTGTNGQYSIQFLNSDYWLIKHYNEGEGQLAKLSLQPQGNPENLRIRLLAFSEEKQTAFYCVDEEHRPKVCVIDYLPENHIIKEFETISFVRFSPDAEISAFIDGSKNALYLYSFDEQKLERKSHYQAKAAFINPQFSSDGQRLYYLVESLENPGDYSVEMMDMESKKILKRLPLSKNEIIKPVAFAVNSAENIFAVLSKTGILYLLSSDGGKTLITWPTGQSDPIGLVFFNDDQLLVSMDAQGRINYWGIEN